MFYLSGILKDPENVVLPFAHGDKGTCKASTGVVLSVIVRCDYISERNFINFMNF